MNKEQLRALVGGVSVTAAPVLTGLVLGGVLKEGAHDAAIILATLSWNHAGTVIRSLFPGPEIDVQPPQQVR